MNTTNLPGGAPVPAPNPALCNAEAGVEVPWSTLEGRRWARVRPPRAMVALGEPDAGTSFGFVSPDLLDWVPAEFGFDTLDAALFARKVDPNDPSGPVDVCVELGGTVLPPTGPPVAVPFLVNGLATVACETTLPSNGQGQVRWTLEPIDVVQCDRGWSP